jgi:hypothetical protein
MKNILTDNKPRKNTLRGHDLECCGAALVEFAFIVGLMILIIFGALEFNHAIGRYQFLSSLSREVAQEAYLKCTYSQENDVVELCLKTIVEGAKEFGSQSIEDLNVIATIYHQDKLDGNIKSLPSNPVISSGATASSRYNLTSVIADPVLNPIVKEQRVIVIAEVAYEFKSIAGFKFISGLLYETTVL